MLGHSKGLLTAVNHGEFDISSVPRVAAIVSVEASFQLEMSLIFLREIEWVVFAFLLLTRGIVDVAMKDFAFKPYFLNDSWF